MASYKRITKPNARKLYNHGCDIVLLPCKVNETALYDSTSNNHWVRPITINIAESDSLSNKFDRAVNNFEYYNCNAELGYYAHYFVSEEDFSRLKYIK